MLGIEKYEDYPHLAILRELDINISNLPKELKQSKVGFDMRFKNKEITEKTINESVILADQIVNWYEQDFEENPASTQKVQEETETKIEAVKEVIAEHVENITIVHNEHPVNDLEQFIDTNYPDGGKIHSDVFINENIVIPVRPLMGFKDATIGKYKITRKAFDSYLYISKI